MTEAINQYMDGMISFGTLSQKDQIWVFMNRPEMVPSGSMLFYMGQ